MNVPSAILQILKCGVCGAQLSRGPVYLQHDGAALCGPCYTPERKATRNTHYEALAQLAVFPCKYSELGCKDSVPFVQGAETIPHEEVCEHRQWVCPVLGSARCDWLGPRAGLLRHCEDQHPDLVLQSPCTLQHDISTSNERTYLLCMLQVLFLLHVKVSVAAGKLYHSVRYLGRSDEVKDFLYTLHVRRNDESLSKKGEVAPQGCLAIQEDTSLSLNINSLLCVLGGFDGAKFTVEVQRRVREVVEDVQQQVNEVVQEVPQQVDYISAYFRRRKREANKLVLQRVSRAAEECAVCGVQGAVLVYRNARYWYCERCAPARQGCKNKAQGCIHHDIINKCHKHETWFCQQLTRCEVCNKAVERDSLSTHRSSACAAVYKADSTWQPTRTRVGQSERCLVSGAAGTAVCRYNLGSVFNLDVYTPVSSERLREFRCVVRVTQPATGLVRIYTPDPQYDQQFDWQIKVGMKEFPRWDCKFDVLVDITKC